MALEESSPKTEISPTVTLSTYSDSVTLS